MRRLELLTGVAPDQLLERMGWSLIHSLWQFTVVAVAAVILSQLVARQNAARRYGIYCGSLLLMLFIPVLVTMTTAIDNAPTASRSFDALSMQPASTRHSVDRHNLGANESATADSAAASEFEPHGQTVGDNGTADTSEVSIVAAWDHESQSRWHNTMTCLAGAWLLGVALISLRQMSGWVWLFWAIKKRTRRVDACIAELLARCCEEQRVQQTVKILEASFAAAPAVVGWWRPVILLPVEVVTGLSVNHMTAVLAHELVHIRRRDSLVNALQAVVETVLFYHPAVWWISGRIRIERENCADDAVVATFGDRVAYAKALTAVAELCPRQATSMVAANGGDLKSRIVRILNGGDRSDRRISVWGWLPVPGLLLILTATMTAPLSALTQEDDPAIVGVAPSNSERDAATTRIDDGPLSAPQSVEDGIGTGAGAVSANPALPAGVSTADETERTADVRSYGTATTAALQRAVRFLESTQQANGSYSISGDKTSRYQAGITALATLALLKADVDPEARPIQRALAFLRERSSADADGMIYEITLEAMLLLELDTPEETPRAKLLIDQIAQGQLASGNWTYKANLTSRGDHSNTGYALRALAAADKAGIQVASEVWDRAANALLASQNADGGWGYTPQASAPSTGNMTCSCLHALALCADANSDLQEKFEAARDKALPWLAKRFTVSSNTGSTSWHFAYLASLSELSQTLDLATFGQHDVSLEVNEFLLKAQHANGSWKELSPPDNAHLTTCFAVLALTSN
jgi:beta-lactamase regulating signal transducer with metallopeptidase domain/prenyltransferase beta subunit